MSGRRQADRHPRCLGCAATERTRGRTDHTLSGATGDWGVAGPPARREGHAPYPTPMSQRIRAPASWGPSRRPRPRPDREHGGPWRLAKQWRGCRLQITKTVVPDPQCAVFGPSQNSFPIQSKMPSPPVPPPSPPRPAAFSLVTAPYRWAEGLGTAASHWGHMGLAASGWAATGARGPVSSRNEDPNPNFCKFSGATGQPTNGNFRAFGG